MAAKKKADPVDPVEPQKHNTATTAPYLGGFVAVVSGEHSGRYGVYMNTLEHDPKTGMPTLINIRTRDEHNEPLSVAYEDCVRAEAGGR